MTSAPRLAAALSALAAVVFIAGCTVGPGAASPQNTSNPSGEAQAPDDDADDMSGALLDDGRMFAVVTWGSSSCVPNVTDVSAQGQEVSVTLEDAEGDQVCTADMAQRASVGALPAGVDPTSDITLSVTYADATDDVEIGGRQVAGVPGEPTSYEPSAGWIDDGSLVLLTWGSSGCPPIVSTIEGSGNAGTVEFATVEGQVCTMDMAPRATLLSFAEGSVDDDAPFTLTLTGGGVDGVVTIPGE